MCYSFPSVGNPKHCSVELKHISDASGLSKHLFADKNRITDRLNIVTFVINRFHFLINDINLKS